MAPLVLVRFDNAKLIDAVIGTWIAERTADEAVKTLQEARVPCSIVNTVDELLDDPQVKAREMILYADHPGLGRIPVPGIPLKLSSTPGKVSGVAPRIGEHNEEIYCGLLHFSSQKLSNLKQDGII